MYIRRCTALESEAYANGSHCTCAYLKLNLAALSVIYKDCFVELAERKLTTRTYAYNGERVPVDHAAHLVQGGDWCGCLLLLSLWQ
jgi:hypothetical protein